MRQRLATLRQRPSVELSLDLLDGTLGDFVRHDGHVYAAAVAFYSSVSMFPFLLLMLSVGGTVLAGFSGGDATESSAAFQDLIIFLRTAVPYLGDDFDETLLALLERRAHFGLAGGAALLLTSSLVFRSLEFALARIFSWREVARPRNVILSKLLFGAFAMSALSIFLGVRYLLGAVRALAAQVDSSLAELLGSALLGEGSLLKTLLWDAVVVLSFMAVLTFFCRSRSRPRQLHSLLGGVLFLLLWGIAGRVFDIYVGRFASMPATYGPWAALIVIQLWIFYSAAVFMVAAEFVKTLERRRAVRGEPSEG